MKATQSIRLTIGRDSMNAFAGLSYGDRFGTADGTVYETKISTYGITLRPAGEPLGTPLLGFVNLPDYHAFLRAVNDAAMNGMPVAP